MSIIPQGSNVLVTGANGFLASHVVDQFLSAGYKVRGAVRSEAKGQWLVDHFTKAYGPGCFELAIVSDMSITGAFDEALTGISGIAHVASDVTFSSNVGEVMSTVEGAIKSILESAMKMPDIKRFVLTSSSVAAVYPFPGQTINVTKNSWNDYSMAQAYETNEEGAQLRGVHVYSASKVAAERALWKFVQERKPSFVANAVLPDFISGKVIGRPWGQQGSTGGLILDMYTDQGEKREAAVGMLNWMPPQWMVDVADTAYLHVAAMTETDIKSERIFAFSEVYNYNDILAALKKAKPDYEFPPESDMNTHSTNVIEARGRADAILRKRFGRGFRTLEESIAESVSAS